MAKERKIESPVTLFAAIEREQHERLRTAAFEERRSMAELVREALDQYLVKRGAKAAGSRAR